jgi:hypothetical protein
VTISDPEKKAPVYDEMSRHLRPGFKHRILTLRSPIRAQHNGTRRRIGGHATNLDKSPAFQSDDRGEDGGKMIKEGVELLLEEADERK